MKKVLSVINCHQKLEIDRFLSLKSKGLENDLEIFGLSRFTGNNLDLFPIFETTASTYELTLLNVHLEIFVDILETEIRADRLFCRIGDFSLPTSRSLPKNLRKELRLVALSILHTVELVQPDYVMLGHADNWISTSISKLCKILDIKSGLAMQIFPGLEYYLVTLNHSYSNPLIDAFIFDQVESIDYSHLENHDFLDSFNIGARTKSSLQPGKKWKKIFDALISVLKREIYAINILFFKKKSNSQSWKYIYKPVPIFDFLKMSLSICRGYFNRVIYFALSKEGLKLFYSNNEAKRIIYLHSSPEAATLWYGRPYVNQIKLVEEVVKLSRGAKVYVKEHPAQLFQLRKLFFYFRIRSMGALFLPRKFSPISSMTKNDALISISGSIAFEANAMQKHCFLAYDGIWYNSLPYVHKLSELADFNFILNSSTNEEQKSLSELEVIGILMQKGLVFFSDSDDLAQMTACRFILDKSPL